MTASRSITINVVVIGLSLLGSLWFSLKNAAAASAFFTAAAAIAATVYVVLTYRLWRAAADQHQEIARQNELQLMLSLMTEYDKLRDSIDFIRGWYMECAANSVDPVERFRNEIGVDSQTASAAALDDHRFRVSRFFVRTRKLAGAGYLSEGIVATALGGRAMEDVFLKMVDPLDEAKAGRHYGSADRRFYRELLAEYPRPSRLRS